METEAIKQLIARWREKDDSEPGWRDWFADADSAPVIELRETKET